MDTRREKERFAELLDQLNGETLELTRDYARHLAGKELTASRSTELETVCSRLGLEFTRK